MSHQRWQRSMKLTLLAMCNESCIAAFRFRSILFHEIYVPTWSINMNVYLYHKHVRNYGRLHKKLTFRYV